MNHLDISSFSSLRDRSSWFFISITHLKLSTSLFNSFKRTYYQKREKEILLTLTNLSWQSDPAMKLSTKAESFWILVSRRFFSFSNSARSKFLSSSVLLKCFSTLLSFSSFNTLMSFSNSVLKDASSILWTFSFWSSFFSFSSLRVWSCDRWTSLKMQRY